MELVKRIQQIVRNYLANAALTDYAVGTVTKINPLEITLMSTMLPLPSAVLILTETVSGRLVVGDKVIMLRVLGGQDYIVLSKAVQ